MDRKMQKKSEKLRISFGGPMLLSTLGEVIGVYRISLIIKVAPNRNFKISRFRAMDGNGGGGGAGEQPAAGRARDGAAARRSHSTTPRPCSSG